MSKQRRVAAHVHRSGQRDSMSSGYVYESSPHAKLERSDRRFHIGIRTYMLVITIAAGTSTWWLS